MKVEFIYHKMSKRDYETFITMLSQMFAEYFQEIKQKEVQNGSGSKIKNKETKKQKNPAEKMIVRPSFRKSLHQIKNQDYAVKDNIILILLSGYQKLKAFLSTLQVERGCLYLLYLQLKFAKNSLHYFILRNP